MQGRHLVYFVVYSLDVMRCIILHLAATQSPQHATNRSDCLTCGVILLDVATVSFVRLKCCDVCAGAKPGVLCGVQLGCHAVYHPTPGSNAEPAACHKQIRLPGVWNHCWCGSHHPGSGVSLPCLSPTSRLCCSQVRGYAPCLGCGFIWGVRAIVMQHVSFFYTFLPDPAACHK